MNERPRLLILAGLHAGASVALEEGRDIRIGSAANADVILADAGVSSRQTIVRLRGGRLELRAADNGVRVFGHALKAGAQTLLRHGTIFSLGEAVLKFSDGAPLTDQATLQAERAWLIAHAPLAWLRKCWTMRPRRLWLLLAAVPVALLLAQGLSLIPRSRAPAPEARLLEQPAFRYVRERIDKETGRHIYEGYVQTAGDLAALSLASRARDGMPTVRVAVIDAMQEQLSDFLDKYYRGTRLQAGEPGAFVAVLPPEDAYLLPESWDYAEVGRLAHAQIDGLQTLSFPGHENASGQVRIPLEVIGLNLVSTPHAAWLADQKGTRYFVGARITLGRITRIAKCSAIVIRDDGNIYRLTTDRTKPSPSC
jgi:hypothetical protein